MADRNVTLYLEFPNNAYLMSLLGQEDGNIKQIEQELGLSIGSRGNQVIITGPKDLADLAKNALNEAYSAIEKGLSVEELDISAQIRKALTPDKNEPRSHMLITTKKRIISTKTQAQQEYCENMLKYDLTFGLGPAGTGKTYLAVAIAVSQMMLGRFDKIILSRPAVEAGERLGFLPGDLKEKVDPYLRPLYDALYDMLPAELVGKKIATGEIEIAPLAFMRGRTLSNAFIILDESQNTTDVQMKMILTRLGEGSKMVVTGDLSQVDLPSGVRSGLRDAVEVLSNVEGIGITYFGEGDVLRHPLVGRIVKAYNKRDEKHPPLKYLKRTYEEN